MDYHFVTPKVKERSSGRIDFNKLLKVVKQFFPVFLLAALLPIMIAMVITPPNVGFFTKADTDPFLRIWVEPATSIVSTLNPVELTIYAQFESETKLIPELTVNLIPEGPLTISENTVTHRTPFRGKVEVARISVQALAPGQSFVQIPLSGVSITAYDGPIEIKTSPAKLMVQ